MKEPSIDRGYRPGSNKRTRLPRVQAIDPLQHVKLASRGRTTDQGGHGWAPTIYNRMGQKMRCRETKTDIVYDPVAKPGEETS